MLKRVIPSMTDGPDPVPTLLTHLETGNDVIRTEAIRAIAATAPGDDRVRVALLASLQDEDPDVRSDAMEALALYARLEDADAIRESLIGDPVREVKLAAVDLLADLQDAASVPILRRLAVDRCDDDVAWEDEAGLWDEWLEIQVAAIRTLGKLGAEEAIKDLLSARDDELGQNLDLPVFDALSRLGNEGMVWLLAVAQTEDGLPRKRALDRMAKLDAAALEPHLDFLLGDDNVEVRRLALKSLAGDDDRLAYLALKDADPSLRCDALTKAMGTRPDLAVAALSDASQDVQAVALDLLALPLADDLAEALDANMQAWLLTDTGPLAVSSARNWLRLMAEPGSEPLLTLIRDGDRPLDARIAATKALATLTDSSSTERLISLLSNPTQQVRLIALTELVQRAEKADVAAIEALSMAAEETLLAPDQQGLAPEAEDTGDQNDDEPVPLMHVSETGEIVTNEDVIANNSTLASIQISRIADRPQGKKAKAKQRRRPIEGPTEIVQELARATLALIGPIQSDELGTTIREMTNSVKDDLRYAAYGALEKRLDVEKIDDEDLSRVRAGLMDRMATIRATATRIAANCPKLHDCLEPLVKDEDAVVRALAIGCQSDKRVLIDAMDDKDSRVRAKALDRLVQTDSDIAMDTLVDGMIRNEAIETIALGAKLSSDIRSLIFLKLENTELSFRDVLILLKALTASSEAPAEQAS